MLLLLLLACTSSPDSAADDSAAPGGWSALPAESAPSPRAGVAAAWTGSELLIWGGMGPDPTEGPARGGAALDPLAGTWRVLGGAGAPAERCDPVAAWSGDELLVYGGANEEGDTSGSFAEGGRYDPALDAWSTFAPLQDEPGRVDHAGAWTGAAICVWGGWSMKSAALDSGGCYDPTTGAWNAMPADGSPSARWDASATWTGAGLAVFGGFTQDGFGSVGSGASYDPAGERWEALPESGARRSHSAIWTGEELVVWGGTRDGYGASEVLGDGVAWSPAAGAWRTISAAGAPSPREQHAAVWTGSRMIVWGGRDAPDVSGAALADGAAYDPATDTWSPLPAAGAPAARVAPVAAWTGSALLIWGGVDASGAPIEDDPGAAYAP